jgi:exopolyphosphatase / guanosine-5'-triphosphate,3'-diphosphate pyrophosphatase
MRVAVIDVGSNTIRLLVASAGRGALAVLDERKAWVRLGLDVALCGAISESRLRAAAEEVSSFAAEARMLGCSRLEVLVASPGRQAENGSELRRRLEAAAAAPVRVLRRDEEARLAYHGAVSCAGIGKGTVAVCDVGGGSTQLAIGLPGRGPAWSRSLDLGSLRLTAQALDRDPPGKKAVNEARLLVRRQFAGLVLPLPMQALAVGGSARALRRLVGGSLGHDELRAAVRTLRKLPSSEIAAAYGIGPERARTLTAGALVLAEVQRRLVVPLTVGRGGVREGAALALAAEQTAA